MITFCNNEICKKRKQCLRAIENHNKDNLPKFNSFAILKCFQEGEKDYFINKYERNIKKYGGTTIAHKYLSEITDIENTPYGFNGENDPRNSEWKEQREIYGFDERETWSLDFTFFCWLYERLKMYNEIHFVNTEFHTIKYEGKTLTQQECMDRMLECCEIIILDRYREDNIIALEEEVLDLWRLSYRLFWW